MTTVMELPHITDLGLCVMVGAVEDHEAGRTHVVGGRCVPAAHKLERDGYLAPVDGSHRFYALTERGQHWANLYRVAERTVARYTEVLEHEDARATDPMVRAAHLGRADEWRSMAVAALRALFPLMPESVAAEVAMLAARDAMPVLRVIGRFGEHVRR